MPYLNQQGTNGLGVHQNAQCKLIIFDRAADDLAGKIDSDVREDSLNERKLFRTLPSLYGSSDNSRQTEQPLHME